MRFRVSRRLPELCANCNFCTLNIACPGEDDCIGCGACVDACPNSAKVMEEIPEVRRMVKITVNGETFEVPERITLLKALELGGYEISSLPGKGEIFAPCRTGGC